MAIEFDPNEQWDRVASELRAYKQSQQQTWGDVDNTTLGRYLADDLSREERQHVEEALTQLPELQKLTDIVRDVLDGFDPAAPAPLPEMPKILPFSTQRFAKKSFGRVLRQRGALLAAACLLLGLGLALGGMRMFTPTASSEVRVASNSTALKPTPPWESDSTQLAMANKKSPLLTNNGFRSARLLDDSVIGVMDDCSLYSAGAIHETEEQIKLFARKHHVKIFTETVANLSACEERKTHDRAKAAGTHGLYLLICKEPPSVQIVASEALQKKGFTPDFLAELKKVMESPLKERDFDRSLVLSIRHVVQRFEKSAAIGAVLGSIAATAAH